MDIYTYQAECGDATRIRFLGSDGNQHNIFIDAGVKQTFRHVLQHDIRKIKSNEGLIDLWIASHIHDDHIGGVIAYLKAIKDGEDSDIVNEWYYNPPRDFIMPASNEAQNEVSSAKSIKQGDAFLHYLKSNKKKYNSNIHSDLPISNLFGLEITILSPNINALQNLKVKYEKVNIINYEEQTQISEAKAASGADYLKRLEDFDLDNWLEDDSIENRSSISTLMEFQGERFLNLADSHPSIIINSLKKMGYSESNPLVCDWVKVSHHGSKGNNSKEMYSLIRCNNYILSVNGENKHYLPAKECIARILRNHNRPKNSHYKLHFTYDNLTLRNIFNSDGNDVFEKFQFSVQFQQEKSQIITANN